MIEIRGLRYSYPGSREETLHGLDFVVGRGEVFGLLGPSGAGKSTTQKILIGLLRGYDGNVLLEGAEVASLGSRLYERVGVSFEVPTLYGRLTALENLRFFASLYDGQTEDPLRLLAMMGLDDAADTRVSAFSKGMKMRLNLCRALLNRPDLVLLDEPTTGQDPGNARRIKDLVLGLKAEGRTVLVNTHNMNVADEVCDRVAFIVDGAIRLVASPRELRLRGGDRTVRVAWRVDGRAVSKDFALAGVGTDPELARILATREIETIHTLEPSLEEVFLQVTGKSLE
jgi:fluoroquinolone transport system ATP-binding protein